MNGLFREILNMSLTGSVVIVLVLAARLLLKRSPKVYSYMIWAVVLFRLLCPVTLTSSISVLRLVQPEVTAFAPAIDTTPVLPNVPTAPIQAAPATPSTIPAPAPQAQVGLMDVLPWLWLAGMAALAVYSLVQYLHLRRDLIGAVHFRGEIWLADHIRSPFVLGFLSPKIYLPSHISPAQRRFIVAHERHHIRRCDPLWKLLGYLALCVHWFNPLVWAAFALAGKDMEMSCDEAVIRRMGPQIRADYAQTLLRLTTHQKRLTGMPLAFGEGDTKSRVKNMARWKRPRVWVSILCLVLCLIVAAVCIFDPQEVYESEPTSGPCDIGFGDLYFTLPEGASFQFRQVEPSEAIVANHGIGTITVGGVQVGGTALYRRLPQTDELYDLPLPEWEDASLGYSGGGDSIEFFSDVPPGQEKTIDREHNFFRDKDLVYDIWFDLLTVDNSLRSHILGTAGIGGVVEFIETQPIIPVEPTQSQHEDGTLTFFLEGIEHQEPATVFHGEGYSITIPNENWSHISRTDDYADVWTSDINSDVSLEIIPFRWESLETAQTWMQERYPSYHLTPSKQGDLFGTATDDRVLSIRFCNSSNTAFALCQRYPAEAAEGFGSRLQVIAGTFSINASVWTSTGNEEEYAIAYLRSALSAAQSGAVRIVSDTRFANQPGQDNTMFYDEYQDSHLRMIAQGPITYADLYAHGRTFGNSKNRSAERVIWEEEPCNETRLPWLLDYQFDQDSVSYIITDDHDPAQTIYCFMIEAPHNFPFGPCYQYAVDLYYENGVFSQVILKGNWGRETEFTITESMPNPAPAILKDNIEKTFKAASK